MTKKTRCKKRHPYFCSVPHETEKHKNELHQSQTTTGFWFHITIICLTSYSCILHEGTVSSIPMDYLLVLGTDSGK